MLFKEVQQTLFFLKKMHFFIIYKDEKPKAWRRYIIKDIRNLLRLKKELNYTAIKDIRNLFRREKETKEIKDRRLRDIKNLFEHEEEKLL